MNKLKTALCLSAALLATSAQAQWQANWVLGVSGEYGWFGNDHNDNSSGFLLNDGSFTNFNVSNNGGDNNNDGWGWGLLGGYQAMCNSWLLGVELAVDWFNNGDDNNNNNSFAFTNVASPAFAARGWNGVASLGYDYSVGLTGRLGYEVSPWFMPYLRAGIETGRDRASFLVTTANNVPAVITASGDSHRQSWRFVGGIGAEVPVPIVAGLGLRAEWNYHSNGRSVDVVSLANDNATLIGVSGKQDMNTAKVSLVYNFPA